MEKVIDIEKLTGRENYHRWKFAVEHAMKLQGFWKAVLGTENDEALMEKATSRLVLYISPNLYVHIQDVKTAKEIWEKLETTYDDSGLTRRCGLLRKLTTTQLVNCNSISEYVDTIVDTAQKLNQIGFKVNDEWIGSLLLSGLPDHFGPMIMAIESSNITITADTIKTKLLQDFDSYNNYATSAESLFYTKLKGKNVPVKNRKIVCYNCKKEGHIAKHCKAPKKLQNGGSYEKTLAASFAAKFDKKNIWLIDSGATSHMVNSKDVFIDFKNFDKDDYVTVANNTRLKVTGIGNIRIQQRCNGRLEFITVNDVLLVPEICANLISVSQLTKKGFEVRFAGGKCVVQKSNKVFSEAFLEKGMFKLSVPSENFVAIADELWHRRLGHADFNVKKLLNKSSGIDCNNGDICTSCLQGKQTRKSYKSSETKTTEILQLVHTDVCGPMEQKSMGGAAYYVLFLDDFSNKIFVYMMRNKSEVPKLFREFKNLVENQTGKRIKTLRSDNGLEYCNSQIKQICDDNGIVHQTSAPYSPQQNGKAERMNRTLVEKARAMLYDANLKKLFWAEATNTAAHLLNIIPKESLNNKSPEEVWSGKKQNLNYLRVFGCVSMVLTPKELRKKWDPRSKRCIMMGYCANSKAYRLYDPEMQKIHISRNVVFIENEMFYLKPGNTNKSMSTPFQDKPNDNTNSVRIMVDENSDPEEYQPDESNSHESDNEKEEDTVDVVDQTPRRSSRLRKPPPMDDYITYLTCENTEDPVTYTDAVNSAENTKWLEAIKSEHNSLIENNTWSIVNNKAGIKKLSTKWIFKKKINTEGEIKYKARLVARGCSQRNGIDYTETYSPVMRYNTLRYLLSFALEFDLHINHLDVCTAFLQGCLEEEIYIEAPEGISVPDNSVLRLNKPLYGLKQASRMWNKRLSEKLVDLGMRQLKTDQCVYIGNENTQNLIVLAVYVDDMIVLWKNKNTKDTLIENLKNEFKMKDLGIAQSFLGIRLDYSFGKSLKIDQKSYIEKILQRFDMVNSNPVSTPMDPNIKLKRHQDDAEQNREKCNYQYQELIGSLLFLAQVTRPDISYAVNLLSRFNNNYQTQHWIAAKRILRYLKGTINLKLSFVKEECFETLCFCDADYASDPDERKSVSGYVLIKKGGAIAWGSKKQQTTALSTCEAEYMAVGVAVQEILWLRGLEQEIMQNLQPATTLFCDNQSAIQLALNESYHPKTKHIDVRHHFIRDNIISKKINLKPICSDKMIADAFTKALPNVKLNQFLNKMGLKCI